MALPEHRHARCSVSFQFPEGLSSAVGMRKAGRSKAYVLGLWVTIAVLSGGASLAGAALLGGVAQAVLATINCNILLVRRHSESTPKIKLSWARRKPSSLFAHRLVNGPKYCR